MSFYTYTIYDYKWMSMLILIFGNDLMSCLSIILIFCLYSSFASGLPFHLSSQLSERIIAHWPDPASRYHVQF